MTLPHLSLAWQHTGQTPLKNKGCQCHTAVPMPVPATLTTCSPFSLSAGPGQPLGMVPKSNNIITQTVLRVRVSVHRPAAAVGLWRWGGLWPHAHHQRPVGPGLPQGDCQSPGDQPSPQQGNKACGAGKLRNNLFLRQ